MMAFPCSGGASVIVCHGASYAEAQCQIAVVTEFTVAGARTRWRLQLAACDPDGPIRGSIEQDGLDPDAQAGFDDEYASQTQAGLLAKVEHNRGACNEDVRSSSGSHHHGGVGVDGRRDDRYAGSELGRMLEPRVVGLDGQSVPAAGRRATTLGMRAGPVVGPDR
jgi:hypothetical protein